MRAFGPILLAAAFAATFFAVPAAAHDHKMVGDYELTIGFATEPAVLGELNAVSLRVLGPAVAPFNSGTLTPGVTFEHVFRDVGTFPYHCHFHEPGMRGNVTVAAAGSGSPTTHHVEILDHRFVPENLAVRVGDTVRWHNNGTSAHDVRQGPPGAHGSGDGHDDHNHDHAPGRKVTGVEETLTVTVRIGGASKTLALEPRVGAQGEYLARFIPTVAGTYTFVFKGRIESTNVDLTHEYTAEPVVRRADLEFPQPTLSDAEVRKGLADAKNATGAGGKDAPGLAAPALLVLLAAAALARRHR